MRTYKDLKAAKQQAMAVHSNGHVKPTAPVVTNGWGKGGMSERTRERVSAARRNAPVTLPKFSWDEN
jgi:hypothetical protein